MWEMELANIATRFKTRNGPISPQERAINASPAFDASLAMEMLGFFSADVREGAAAVREKRQPKFPGFKGR